jgi:WhiB family transcriptional regulator, redox-sensing transcriptional regulator
MDWLNHAACAGRDDVDYFDLDCYLQAALELCVTCPVADHCLDYAIRHGITEGVWGGAWGSELLGMVSRPGREVGRG